MRGLLPGMMLVVAACGGAPDLGGDTDRITGADPCIAATANHTLDVRAGDDNLNAWGTEDRGARCDRFVVDVRTEIPVRIEVALEADLDAASCDGVRGHINYYRLRWYEDRPSWVSGVTVIGLYDPTTSQCHLAPRTGDSMDRLSQDGLRLGITTDLGGQPLPVRVTIQAS